MQTSNEEIYVNVQCMCICAKSCLTLCDQKTIACPAPLSLAFSRKEY